MAAHPSSRADAILLRAAELADERTAQIAATISAENGKTITEATTEAGRSGELIRLSAFEGTQLYGDTLPLDANKGTGLDKSGSPSGSRRGRCRDHPVAENAVVLKPARNTPPTALALAACPRVKIGLFMGVAFLAWFYGMHLMFNFSSVQSGLGIGNEFIYIIAAVVGGCLLTGGYGSAAGAAVGAFIFGMTTQGIVFAGFDPNWFYTFLGAMLLLAVLVNLYVKNYASTRR